MFWNWFPVFLPIPLIINFLLSFSQLYLGQFDLDLINNRAIGTFGQSNFLAGYLLAMIPFCFYFIYTSKDLVAKIYQITGLIAAVFTLYWTGSRLGYVLGIVIIGFNIITLLLLQFKEKKQRFAILSGGAVILLAILIPVLIFWYRFRIDGLIDESRFLIWNSSVDAIIDEPIIGYGLDNAGYVIPSYMYENGVNTPVSIDRAHNEYLDIALNMGIPGLIISIILLVLIFGKYLTIIMKEEDNEVKLFMITVVLSSSVFLVRSLVNVNGINNYILFAFMIGIVIVQIIDLNQKKDWLIKSKYLKHLSYLSIFTIWIIISFGLIQNLNFLQADADYKIFLKVRDVSIIDEAVNKNPYQVRYRMELMGQLMKTGEEFDKDEVMPMIFEEQDLNYSQFYYLNGKYYELNGEIEKADEMYDKAFEMEPVRPEYER